MQDGSESKALIVVSIGDRPWFPILLPSIRAYALRIGATLKIYSFAKHTGEHKRWLTFLPEGLGNDAYRFLKLYYLAKTLQDFERVLLLDDTCFVTAHCPDIFSACEKDKVGAVLDRGGRGSDNHELPVINTGVLAMSTLHLPLLENVGTIYSNQVNQYDDQQFLNQAALDGKVDYALLDSRFNVVGSQITESDVVEKSAYIYHLTSHFNDSTRLDLAAKFVS